MAPDGFAIPSSWVRRFAHLVPRGGEVVDMAAGGGRHARFFLERGHPVVAVDRNLGAMAELGRRPDLAMPGLTLIEADLEAADAGDKAAVAGAGWPFTGRSFAGVIVCNYLYRPLFPSLVASVAPGGALLYETFGMGNEAYGRPSNPDFLLCPGELLASCTDLQIVAYEHGVIYAPKPAVVSRIAAVRALLPQPL